MGDPGAEETFGQWLRRRRRSLDLTQVELAARVPCAKGTIRRLESDDLRPSKPLAERLADVLGLSTQMRANFVLFARNGIQHVALTGSPVADVPDADVALSHGASPSMTSHRPAARRYSMPAPTTTLIGRVHAVSVAVELLLRPDVRLVTLIGPPGVGKTRLAQQVAEQIQSKFQEGACFVALAPVGNAENVLAAIAQAIDLLDNGRMLAAALAERLRSEELVLVLDNFEHVVDAAPEIAALLSAAPGLKVLCTSRVALRIWGEHEFIVTPLTLPDLANLSTQTALAANPAVALFVARASAAHPGFVLTSENVQQIAEICHRLDGLPLAIELAATRIKLFSPVAILARLERRLPFLTGGARNAPDRQRTLEAAIAWSYDLLSVRERVCLARLGVFWGGWTVESAEAVCGDDADVIGTLATLVDHSLVQSTHGKHGDVRFTMLETIREFALMRLEEQGEMVAVQARHAQFFLSLAVAAEHGLQGAEQVDWMARLNADNNNLRAAFAWSQTPQGNARLGLQASAALWWFWWTNGQVGEGRRWFHDLMQHAANEGLAGTSDFGRALLGAGILAFFAGDFAAAMPHFEQARDLGERVGDTITHGYAIFMIGTVMMLSRHLDEGHTLVERGTQILQNSGAPAAWHVGVTSLARTLLSLERSDLDAAQLHADTGMAIFRRLGQPYGIGLAFNYQGDVARLRGDHAVAARRYEAALPLLQQANAKSEIPAVLHNHAHVVLAQNDTARAGALFTEGLELHREIGNRMGMAECLIGLATVAIAQDQPQATAMILGAINALLATLNAPLFAAEQIAYQRAMVATQRMLSEAEWEAGWNAGQAMTLAEAISAVSALKEWVGN
jgi:predicted ATPase/DNA-binding XRE family transcriptional regulator